MAAEGSQDIQELLLKPSVLLTSTESQSKQSIIKRIHARFKYFNLKNINLHLIKPVFENCSDKRHTVFEMNILVTGHNVVDYQFNRTKFLLG